MVARLGSAPSLIRKIRHGLLRRECASAAKRANSATEFAAHVETVTDRNPIDRLDSGQFTAACPALHRLRIAFYWKLVGF
jgi:hypothetical protein